MKARVSWLTDAAKLLPAMACHTPSAPLDELDEGGSKHFLSISWRASRVCRQRKGRRCGMAWHGCARDTVSLWHRATLDAPRAAVRAHLFDVGRAVAEGRSVPPHALGANLHRGVAQVRRQIRAVHLHEQLRGRGLLRILRGGAPAWQGREGQARRSQRVCTRACACAQGARRARPCPCRLPSPRRQGAPHSPTPIPPPSARTALPRAHSHSAERTSFPMPLRARLPRAPLQPPGRPGPAARAEGWLARLPARGARRPPAREGKLWGARAPASLQASSVHSS